MRVSVLSSMYLAAACNAMLVGSYRLATVATGIFSSVTRLERWCRLSAVLFVVSIVATSAAAADRVEFLSGANLTGSVKEIRGAKREFDFEAKIGNQTLIRTYSFSKVHAVTIKGKRYVLTPKLITKPPSDGNAPSAGDRGSTRTRVEINRLINEAGTTPPDGFDSVSLNYPKTIDLSWPKYTGPWDPKKDVGQFIWSSINENPRRWKEGTKFLHHVLSVNENNPEAQQKTFEKLGHCYHDLLGDWARGAFWWRKCKKYEMTSFLGLADCYWKLGSKEMATEQLNRIRTDRTRYGSVIKLWSDMGELEKALRLAETSAQAGNPSGAYVAAGDACRQHGRFATAIAYYRKVLPLPTTGRDGKKNGILDRNRQSAQTAIGNIKTFETLDLSRIPDGTYSGTSLAYIADLTVAVTVKSGRMMSVRVTKHKDKQYYSALTDTPQQIIEKQGLKGVDATSGATITSQAIIDATAKALAKGED
jgi:uncharacterized protein with FMN-binding domain